MEQIETKIKLESDIITAQRDLKYTLSQLTNAKNECNSVMKLKDNLLVQIEEAEKYLTEITKDIASAKLAWVTEKEEQAKELADKMYEAQQVIDKKSELEHEVLKIQKIKDDVTEARNEKRQIEFNIKQEKEQLKNMQAGIKENLITLEKENALLEEKKQKFKDEITQIILSKINEL